MCMMASTVSSSENLIAGNAEFEAMGAFNVDEALLIALLEESQVEEPEDERLGYVMRSLEAEIDPNRKDGRAPAADSGPGNQGNSDDYRSKGFGLEYSKDCSSGSYASSTYDFDWLDMEMASSSLSDEMGNWYDMDSFGDELAGMVEFGEMRDYSQFCYAAPVEDHAYGSLWQETFDSMMFD